MLNALMLDALMLDAPSMLDALVVVDIGLFLFQFGL